MRRLCLWKKILFYGKFLIFLKRLQEASHKTYRFSNALFNWQAEVLSLGKGNLIFWCAGPTDPNFWQT